MATQAYPLTAPMATTTTDEILAVLAADDPHGVTADDAARPLYTLAASTHARVM